MKNLTILGSTGSIGTNTLKIVSENPHLFKVKALVAGCNVDLMTKQCHLFKPDWAALFDKQSAQLLQNRLQEMNTNTKVLAGEEAACELASLDDVDQVMSALVGVVGLRPTIAAIKAGKQVLLANKESLVTSGRFFMEAVCTAKVPLLPVDSEHNAIFQSLPSIIQNQLGNISLINNGIQSIILTGSGGPFRNLSISEFKKITPEQACTHPNWKMGKKISVDSATMMNKGLEYIEAHWLFNASPEQLEILIHPQSIIHSMVRYIDGSVLAQLGFPDMKIPIAHAMAWPTRIHNTVMPLDFTKLKELTFFKPDLKRYPCLKLAIEACKKGQLATIILNAANEIAVNAFLNKKIPFTAIPAINSSALEYFYSKNQEPTNIEEVIEVDRLIRISIKELLSSFNYN
ncbi:MAG: 1-deoxy-D-xylulose-5-phosphate reductoisomerase [Candidatus Dasytiphilus stammeri]